MSTSTQDTHATTVVDDAKLVLRAPSWRALPAIDRLVSRKGHLDDLKELVRWFQEEERAHIRDDEHDILARFLRQRHFLTPKEDRELARLILAVELRKGR